MITKPTILGGTQIRCKWNDDEDQWYYVVEDVLSNLLDKPSVQQYWLDLKAKSLGEFQLDLSSLCRPLKVEKDLKLDSADSKAIQAILALISEPQSDLVQKWLLLSQGQENQNLANHKLRANPKSDSNEFEVPESLFDQRLSKMLQTPPVKKGK